MYSLCDGTIILLNKIITKSYQKLLIATKNYLSLPKITYRYQKLLIATKNYQTLPKTTKPSRFENLHGIII
jgi:hypothetical protein